MSTGCTNIKASAFLLENRKHIRSICYDFGSAKIYLPGADDFGSVVSRIFAGSTAFYNVLIMAVFDSIGCFEIISSFQFSYQYYIFILFKDA